MGGLLHAPYWFQTLYLHMRRMTSSQPSTRPLLRRHPIRQLEATIKQLLIRCLLPIKTQTSSYHIIPTYPKAITPKPSSLPLLWTPKLSVNTLLKTSSAPPKANERLLLLVATSHPSFASHWFRIYEVQAKGRKPLIFGDVLFFQIEAEVLKNVYRSNSTGGLYTQKKFGALFLSRGGAALSLSFPGCPRSFEFELKSADVFFSCESLQVWGTTKTVRSVRKQLSKLKTNYRESCISLSILRNYMETSPKLSFFAMRTLPFHPCHG
jgi:hypothetical protein